MGLQDTLLADTTTGQATTNATAITKLEHFGIHVLTKALSWVYHEFTDRHPLRPKDIDSHRTLCELHKKHLDKISQVPEQWDLDDKNRPKHNANFQELIRNLKKRSIELKVCNPIFRRQVIGSVQTIVEIFKSLENRNVIFTAIRNVYKWKNLKDNQYRPDGVEQMFFSELAAWIGAVLPIYPITDRNTIAVLQARIDYCHAVQKQVLEYRNDPEDALCPKNSVGKVIKELEQIKCALEESCQNATFNQKISNIDDCLAGMSDSTFDMCHLISDAQHNYVEWFHPEDYLELLPTTQHMNTLMACWISKTLRIAEIKGSTISISKQINFETIERHLEEELLSIKKFSQKDDFQKSGLPFSAYMKKGQPKNDWVFDPESGKKHLKRVIDMHRSILKLLNVRHSLELAKDVVTAYGQLWLYGDKEGGIIMRGLLRMFEHASESHLEIVSNFWKDFYGEGGLSHSLPGTYLAYHNDKNGDKDQTFYYLLSADDLYKDIGQLQQRVIDVIDEIRKNVKDYKGNKEIARRKKQILTAQLRSYMQVISSQIDGDSGDKILLSELNDLFSIQAEEKPIIVEDKDIPEVIQEPVTTSNKTSNETKAQGKEHRIADDFDNMDDTHWYTDDEVNTLLMHYLTENNDIERLTAMLGTHLNERNDLHVNLVQFNNGRMRVIRESGSIKNKVVIPVNLNLGHWVLLYITYQENQKESPTINYFDPLGQAPHKDIVEALSQSDLFPGVTITPIGEKVQQDSYNCGPWVVEAVRGIAQSGILPGVGHDIDKARSEHMAVICASDILYSQQYVNIAPQHKAVLTIAKSQAKEYINAKKLLPIGQDIVTESVIPDYIPMHEQEKFYSILQQDIYKRFLLPFKGFLTRPLWIEKCIELFGGIPEKNMQMIRYIYARMNLVMKSMYDQGNRNLDPIQVELIDQHLINAIHQVNKLVGRKGRHIAISTEHAPAIFEVIENEDEFDIMIAHEHISKHVKLLEQALAKKDNIIFSLKKYIRYLEVEKDTLKEQLKEKGDSVDLLTISLKKQKEHIDGVISELEKKKVEISRLSLDKKELEKKLADLRITLDQLDDTLKDKQKVIGDTRDQLEQKISAIAKLKIEKTTIERKLTQSDNSVTQLEKDLIAKKEEINLIKTEVERRASTLSVVEQQLRQDIESRRTTIEVMRVQLEQKSKEITKLNASKEDIKQVLNEAKASVTKLKQESQEFYDQIKMLSTELDKSAKKYIEEKKKLSDELTKKSMEIDKLKLQKSDLKKNQERISQLESELKGHSGKIKKLIADHEEVSGQQTNEIRTLNRVLQEKTGELSVLETKESKLNLEITDINDSLRRMKKEAEHCDMKTKKMQQDLDDKSAEIVHLRGRKEDLKEKLHAANVKIITLEKELEGQCKVLSHLRTQIEKHGPKSTEASGRVEAGLAKLLAKVGFLPDKKLDEKMAIQELNTVSSNVSKSTNL